MDATFHLSTRRSLLEANRSVLDTILQLLDALSTDILKAMLDTSSQISQELLQLALVNDGTTERMSTRKSKRKIPDALSDLDLVCFRIISLSSGISLLHGIKRSHTAISLESLSV